MAKTRCDTSRHPIETGSTPRPSRCCHVCLHRCRSASGRHGRFRCRHTLRLPHSSRAPHSPAADQHQQQRQRHPGSPAAAAAAAATTQQQTPAGSDSRRPTAGRSTAQHGRLPPQHGTAWPNNAQPYFGQLTGATVGGCWLGACAGCDFLGCCISRCYLCRNGLIRACGRAQGCTIPCGVYRCCCVYNSQHPRPCHTQAMADPVGGQAFASHWCQDCIFFPFHTAAAGGGLGLQMVYACQHKYACQQQDHNQVRAKREAFCFHR